MTSRWRRDFVNNSYEISSTKPLPQLALSVCVSKGGAALARKGKQHIRHKEEDEEEEEGSEIVGVKRDGDR